MGIGEISLNGGENAVHKIRDEQKCRVFGFHMSVWVYSRRGWLDECVMSSCQCSCTVVPQMAVYLAKLHLFDAFHSLPEKENFLTFSVRNACVPNLSLYRVAWNVCVRAFVSCNMRNVSPGLCVCSSE
jgi:hypothetical protein